MYGLTRYRSRNGLYSAEQDFATAGRGWNGIAFETAHGDTLEGLGGTGLSIKALALADCAAPDAEPVYAPVRRRDGDAQDFYVIAATERATSWIVVSIPQDAVSNGAASLSQPCAPLDPIGSIAFDAKCPLPSVFN